MSPDFSWVKDMQQILSYLSALLLITFTHVYWLSVSPAMHLINLCDCVA